MSPQPTQAHLDKATCWWTKRPFNVSHQIDSLAQLIADSEARVVSDLLAQLAAEREKVRVLRSTLERRHTEQGYHRQYVDDVLDATKEASK
jgi:hypothetical protein